MPDTVDSPEAPASRRGLLLVVSGPSGVGKTTIVHRIIDRFNGVFSVSATTRECSSHETDGVDYFFLDEPTFRGWIDEGRFLEFAQVFGRSSYGTPRDPVEDRLREGRLVVLDIDVQGAIQVRANTPDAFGVFILPPDEGELLRRLRARGREDEATIERRFSEARHEMSTARTCGAYNAFVVNDDLERVVEETVRLIESRLKDRSSESKR
ncbi:MAG: guanylate kinase [Planctomycetota bacterium]|jgi:guanylate kinase|nr:guanylate kinase [Planctomycetota bacterium]MDA1025075.1 guanylate kinase [Planctomycetota bacterium]